MPARPAPLIVSPAILTAPPAVLGRAGASSFGQHGQQPHDEQGAYGRQAVRLNSSISV